MHGENYHFGMVKHSNFYFCPPQPTHSSFVWTITLFKGHPGAVSKHQSLRMLKLVYSIPTPPGWASGLSLWKKTSPWAGFRAVKRVLAQHTSTQKRGRWHVLYTTNRCETNINDTLPTMHPVVSEQNERNAKTHFWHLFCSGHTVSSRFLT